MCHLGGDSMRDSVVTWLKGGTLGGSSLATLSHQGWIQGGEPQGVCGARWGPRGQWGPAGPSWLSWHSQGGSRECPGRQGLLDGGTGGQGKAGQCPGWSPPPPSQIKSPFTHKGEVLVA